MTRFLIAVLAVQLAACVPQTQATSASRGRLPREERDSQPPPRTPIRVNGPHNPFLGEASSPTAADAEPFLFDGRLQKGQDQCPESLRFRFVNIKGLRDEGFDCEYEVGRDDQHKSSLWKAVCRKVSPDGVSAVVHKVLAITDGVVLSDDRTWVIRGASYYLRIDAQGDPSDATSGIFRECVYHGSVTRAKSAEHDVEMPPN